MYRAPFPATTPATGLVTCIIRADPFNPNSAITHIGIDGTVYTDQQVLASVKAHPRWMHTYANGKIAYLVAGGFPPYEYVTTEPDCSLANNLGVQPRCR
jgi:Protein of unknown function (DUF3892)